MSDRPANAEEGIAITPAMIDAGILAFSEYDSDYEQPSDAVREIYVAMVKAREASLGRT
jgi:hypothetical protein